MLLDGVDVPALLYVSGRMTGTEDHGVAVFTSAREALRERGYTVLCPSEATVVHKDYTRQQHLRRDISMVVLADEVCVLEGWEHSTGACIEVMIAIAIGLPVWEYDTGQRIDDLVLAAMDPRRFLIPIDFENWARAEAEVIESAIESKQRHETVEDFKREFESEWIIERCGAMGVPYRGASAVQCDLSDGHRGDHVNEATGMGW